MTADVTQSAAWQRGVEAAKRATADADKTAPKQPDVRADICWQPNGEPVVYCPAPGCGLTVGPGHARCWVHRPVDRADLKGRLEGRLG